MGYLTVTEMPGNRATRENLEMLYSRYKWASQFVQGKDVLEMAIDHMVEEVALVIGVSVDNAKQKITIALKNYPN